MSEKGSNNEAIEPAPPAEGYDRLGKLMGDLPEVSAFRKFGALSAEDLLYRQAELTALEMHLRMFQKEDKESKDEYRERYAYDWQILSESGRDDAPAGHDNSQLATILEIREKLKDYHKALLRHRRVYEIPRPLAGQLKSLDEWMQRPTRGNVYLEGVDGDIWQNPNIDDMVTLKPPSHEDDFTSEFTLKLITQYNKLIGRHIHKAENEKAEDKDFLKNTIRYRDEGTFRVLKTLATLVACLLPVASIAVLYAIQNMPSRLGAIAVFVAVFSFSLNLLSTASTKDIFGATAAFAAVLVVFIGTNDGSYNTRSS